MRRSISFLVTLILLTTPLHAQSKATAAARELSEAFAAAAAIIRPAVVNISTHRVEKGRRQSLPPMFRDLFGDMPVNPDREVASLGSGVIIRPDGYVVTNCHVVAGAQEITVSLADESEYQARLIGQDAYTDLAVVKIDATDLPVARFGDSEKLKVGEWVLAIGSPLGLAQTVTAGIVSATGRSNIGIESYENFIQTDAAINPGNSGGALADLDGKLIGINTAIASEGGGYDGVCFATPSATVLPVVEALMKNGSIRRPWIGLIPKTVDRRALTKSGVDATGAVSVSGLIRGGPAHQARLTGGDILTEWDGKSLRNTADLSRLVQSTSIGRVVKIKLYRQGQCYETSVTVGERPQGVRTMGVQ
ncbi:MAG: S1C family serine protease [Bacteroidota bacterium]